MKGSYRELHSAIIRAGFTCSNLASAIGISPQALSHKMNGYSLFTAKEIARMNDETTPCLYHRCMALRR